MTREEIAKELAGHLTVPMHVLDAVRALPVIATCGECRWVTDDPNSPSDPDSGTWCGRDPRRRRVSTASEPPEWCPLRRKR